MAERLGERQLLWIDVDGRAPAEIGTVASAVKIESSLVKRLVAGSDRADLTQYPDHVHLVIHALEAPDAPETPADTSAAPTRHAFDVVAGRNWVVTVHDGAVKAFERFDATTEGDTRLGALDAASFVGSIADEVLADYLELAEAIEREIDRLDERALRHQPRNDILTRIVSLRRRIGLLRRTLAPHRWPLPRSPGRRWSCMKSSAARGPA